MTPDVAAALDLLSRFLEHARWMHMQPRPDGVHHVIHREEAADALTRVAQALADGAEGERLHEELYAAAVAENERIRAGWNAAEQALAAETEKVAALQLMSGKEMREDGFWVAGEAAEALRALLSPAPRREGEA